MDEEPEPREVKQLTQGHTAKEGQSQTRMHYPHLLRWYLKYNCRYFDPPSSERWAHVPFI